MHSSPVTDGNSNRKKGFQQLPAAAPSRTLTDSHAAINLQPSRAARRQGRSVPDEHVDRRTADCVVGRGRSPRWPDVRRLDDRMGHRGRTGGDRGVAGERLPRRQSGGGSTIARRLFLQPEDRHVGAARHGIDDAAVQFRVRLLLPGRSRRPQQVRRQDVARHGAPRRRAASG